LSKVDFAEDPNLAEKSGIVALLHRRIANTLTYNSGKAEGRGFARL
jgi:hypothetical protein